MLVLAILLSGCKGKDLDADEDGSPAAEDCDDTNPRVRPGLDEECDELDNDCDGSIDEGVQLELHRDEDGDSFGGKTVLACSTGGWIVADGTDCDDDDRGVHPGAQDLCDGRDDDCDGADGEPVPWYADADGDGYGSAETKTLACAAPADFVADATDCDDGDGSVHPGAVEDCENTIDENCDGLAADEIDHDGDGGYSDTCPGGTDCVEFDPDIHVGAKETCGDGVDSDCSGADLACDTAFEGVYHLGDASAVVTDDFSSLADAGRVMRAGDVTGDGIDDAFAGALWAHHGAGGGWVVPGPVSGAVSLEDVGFDLEATDETHGAGRSIGLGDVNGDGIDDIAFGCPYAVVPGQYILYGPITSDGRIADQYDAAIHSPYENGDLFSHGSDLGDVDGDGIDDSVVAAWAGSVGGTIQSGTLWVTFGPLTGDLYADTDAEAIVAGEHDNANAGRIVHVDDDLDGDGLEDIVLNAIFDDTAGPNAGAVYVVYGPADVSSLADAATLVGPAATSFTGQEFTSGDYDGDGYGEVTVYVPGEQGVYVARGPLADTTDLAAADAILEGEFTADEFGYGLASGDLDGDGNDDLLVGAPSHDHQTGVAYLVPDPPSGTSKVTDVAVATFEGDMWASYAGQAMAVGDMNGDGGNDLVLGAPGFMGSGGVYVQYAE
jgi:hypothetical protein